MHAPTYKLEQFEGPLDLLLTLIEKNKMDIMDIQISLICDQYLEYLEQMQSMDLEIAGSFIDMASYLIALKSKMLVPKIQPDEPDPRMDLAENLLRYQQAKEAAAKLQPLYTQFSRRMVKDTDEISIDKSFVADQDVLSLTLAVRRIISYIESKDRMEKEKIRFSPLVAKPIVPVEAKIVGIIRHVRKKPRTTLNELLRDARSIPDLIAIFLGVLELVKMRKLLIDEEELPSDDSDLTSVHSGGTSFHFNEDMPEDEVEFSSEYDTPAHAAEN